MNYNLLPLLRCPISKEKLVFQLILEEDCTRGSQTIKEVKEGILFSPLGFIFPIIDGVPRMLIEAYNDYADWVNTHVPNIKTISQKLENDFTGLIKYCKEKNKKTKQSFALEWGLMNYEKADKLWHNDINQLTELFLSETNETKLSLKGKTVIDVGSGHGLMSQSIAEHAETIVGVEMSRCVENAYKNLKYNNIWFIQADLQFLPFPDHSFDLLYSSGVIHHTRNTELAFLTLEHFLKPQGKLSLWLYHPRKNKFHNTILFLRKISTRMPLRLLYVLLLIIILPPLWLLHKVKGKQTNWREILVDLLDSFSPEYRFEHTFDEAKSWLQKRSYQNIQMTTKNTFGFSIVGSK